MSFSVSEILGFIEGRVVNLEVLGDCLNTIRVDRPSSLAYSTAHDLAFFFSKAFMHELPTAHPGILITGDPFVSPLEKAGLSLWKGSAVISCADPYLALALLSEKFAPSLSSAAHVPGILDQELLAPQIHPTAVVSPSADLALGVEIGAHCVIEDQVQIGRGTVVYAGCVIGKAASIGENGVLFPGVVLYEGTRVGDRVRLHSGVVLGSDGFGYAPKRAGKKVVGHQKIYHLGKVIVGDDVEIGANSCVDRGTFGDTSIANQVKLDNLVHVGHNARLDEGAIVCGGTCLAGNAKIGKFAYIGGLSGITNHVEVGDGGSVGALTLVTKDVEPGGTAVGNPQREYKAHFRVNALLNKLLGERRKK